MSLREVVFAVILLFSFAVIDVGFWAISRPVGLIGGGVLFAGWAWLVLAEVS